MPARLRAACSIRGTLLASAEGRPDALAVAPLLLRPPPRAVGEGVGKAFDLGVSVRDWLVMGVPEVARRLASTTEADITLADLTVRSANMVTARRRGTAPGRLRGREACPSARAGTASLGWGGMRCSAAARRVSADVDRCRRRACFGSRQAAIAGLRRSWRSRMAAATPPSPAVPPAIRMVTVEPELRPCPRMA